MTRVAEELPTKSLAHVVRLYPCTAGMLLVIWAVFVAELAMHATSNPTKLMQLGALPTSGLRVREAWRLLTYAVLHKGWIHLLVNTYLLLMSGPP